MPITVGSTVRMRLTPDARVGRVLEVNGGSARVKWSNSSIPATVLLRELVHA